MATNKIPPEAIKRVEKVRKCPCCGAEVYEKVFKDYCPGLRKLNVDHLIKREIKGWSEETT